jgi:S-adenosylhomocysteine hydrolase
LFDGTPSVGRSVFLHAVDIFHITAAWYSTSRRGTAMAGSGSGSATSSLRRNGIEVIGEATTDQAEHETHLKQVLAARPDMLLDNGGDLFVTYLTEPYQGLLGGTEETTSRRMRLQRRAAELKVPALVINDNPIKQVAENRHAVGQSVLASFLRITNLMTNGRCVAVFGYGACDQGPRRQLPQRLRHGPRSRGGSSSPAGGEPRRLRGPCTARCAWRC